MAEFLYVAIDKNGKERKGSLEAENRERAYDKLKNEGMILLDLNEANALNKDIKINLGGKVKPRDLSVFCRQFVSMINAGVTIVDALNMLSDQTENKRLAEAIRQVRIDIEKGESMADAMVKHDTVFPSIMVSMTAAGEASGKLDTAFSRMADQFEKSAKLQAMIKKAMIYPIILFFVAIIVVAVFLIKVIPSYTDMFEQLGSELPGITRAVVAASDFVVNNFILILVVIAALVIGIKIFAKTENGKDFFGNLAIKVPVMGKLNVKTACSNFARTLSTLLYSGVPMIDALEIVSRVLSNSLYKKALLHAKEEVAKGVPLSEPIASSGLFPPMVSHMTKIGEETGDVEEMLNRLADYYDEEVQAATESLTAAMEPMIILVLAGIVGILVAAIMAPMVKMYGDLEHV
ncbi:type II secretion system F family protein [Roseburia sp. 499]|uniref:type II secretion system F family protein n=1 Tax=Roseburia sp. 499 TaxID=1261634 RepID=UPI00095176CC|nr:type II secretion system F family protein [Roseburia sp. 499]WVK70651.1 type II secretion system F family protein [Roseburia sp. 499]